MLFVISSCQVRQYDNRKFNVKDAFHLRDSLLVDNLIDSVWYVRLETTDDCLLSMNNSDIEISNRFIYCLSDNVIYLFSIDGKYISKIDNHGHGPSDLGFINSIEWNDMRNELYAWDGMHRRLMVYDNKLNHKRNIPFVGGYSMLADSNFLYVGLIRDDFRKRGVENCMNKIDINTGNIVDMIKSRISSIETDEAPYFSMGTSIYKYKDNIKFLEHRSDSVFSYYGNDSIVFSYYLNIGDVYPADLDYPGNKMQNNQKNKYVDIKPQFESENFIFLTASYLGEKRIWLLCSKKDATVIRLYSKDYNEIDGGFPFVWFESVGGNVYYCGNFWPEDLLNDEMVKQIKYNGKCVLKKMLLEVEEDENSFLMFVKFKKEYE